VHRQGQRQSGKENEIAMSTSMQVSWGQVSWQILQAAALFVVATFVFDAIHYTLHRCLNSRWTLLRRLASLHQAHHDLCDRLLVYHEEQVLPNLVLHLIPEYATQMVVCWAALMVLDSRPVFLVIGGFTAIFGCVMVMRGKDRNHLPLPTVPVARERLVVRAPYHALYHVYPESSMGSHTTLFDIMMGTACQIRGRRVALTGSSGSFGSAMKGLLERAGAVVLPLRFGVDYTHGDYSGADGILATADILVLADGAKGEQAMQANCDSSLALIERFNRLTRHRQVPVEVWAVGSEIECHPAFGDVELKSYALSKRAYARYAARLAHDGDVLYRHIVPTSFRSGRGADSSADGQRLQSPSG
jgi:hypothetical protein